MAPTDQVTGLTQVTGAGVEHVLKEEEDGSMGDRLTRPRSYGASADGASADETRARQRQDKSRDGALMDRI